MKPMVIVVVMFVTVSVVGIASLQVQHGGPSEYSDAPTYVPFSGAQSTVSNHEPPQETVSEIASIAAPRDVSGSETQPLRLVNLADRRAFCTDDQEKWTWRVEVENNSPQEQFCYVEIEWLDETGARIDFATELRRIKPGTHSISMVRPMDWETADQANKVRVAKLEVR